MNDSKFNYAASAIAAALDPSHSDESAERARTAASKAIELHAPKTICTAHQGSSIQVSILQQSDGTISISSPSGHEDVSTYTRLRIAVGMSEYFYDRPNLRAEVLSQLDQKIRDCAEHPDVLLSAYGAGNSGNIELLNCNYSLNDLDPARLEETLSSQEPTIMTTYDEERITGVTMCGEYGDTISFNTGSDQVTFSSIEGTPSLAYRNLSYLADCCERSSLYKGITSSIGMTDPDSADYLIDTVRQAASWKGLPEEERTEKFEKMVQNEKARDEMGQDR